jgi:hypothetical protein
MSSNFHIHQSLTTDFRNHDTALAKIRAALKLAAFKHPEFEKLLSRRYLLKAPMVVDKFHRQNREGKRLRYELLRITLKDDFSGLMAHDRFDYNTGLYLIMQDATSLEPNVIRVDPKIKNCREALAWSFGFEEADEYFPLVES